MKIKVCDLCYQEFPLDYIKCPKCVWDLVELEVTYGWNLNCRECGRLICHYFHETEYDPDGYSITGAICMKCEKKNGNT